jgi:hypothetical protein
METGAAGELVDASALRHQRVLEHDGGLLVDVPAPPAALKSALKGIVCSRPSSAPSLLSLPPSLMFGT